MKLRDIMSELRLETYPEIALLLFLAAFLLVCMRLLLAGSAAELSQLARLPLNDDEPAGGRPDTSEERR